MPPPLKLNENAKQILRHRFTDESGKEYEGTEFGGFGEYIANKVIKLQNQAQEAAIYEDEKSDIFRGCIIYITGYTQPSIFELKRMIVLNGGIHAQYLNGKTSVTHIVASSLTPRKRIEFAKFKVVLPQWIVDSVKGKKLLSWSDYRTIQVKTSLIQGPKKFVVSGDKSLQESSPKKGSGETSLQRENSKEKDLDERNLQEKKFKEKNSPGKPGPIRLPVKVPIKFKVVNEEQEANERENDDFDSDDEELNNLLFTTPSKRDKPEIDTAYNGDSPSKKFKVDMEDGHGEGDSEGEVEVEIGDKGLGEEEDKEGGEGEVDTDTSLNHIPSASLDSPIQHIPHGYVDCLHPDFIPSYYRNSRLHHLSTWKADLKRKFQNLAQEQNRKSQESRFQKDTGSRIIFHVDYDCFFVSVALLDRPDLRDKPVCVSNSSSGNSDVASCNYIARKFGIRNGMWVSQAIKKCPGLIALDYNFTEYEKASSTLYQVLVEFNPDLLFPVSVDEALIDFTTTCNEMVDTNTDIPLAVTTLANRLRNRIRELSGLEASVGVGPNVLLAKVALKSAKPSGQKYISTSHAIQEISNVLIEDLPGMGSHISRKLSSKMNIRTAGQIRNYKKSDLEALLGSKTASKIYDYAFGLDDTDISNISDPKSVGVEIAWAIRLKNEQEVDLFLSNLTLELCRRMNRIDVKGKHLTLKIYQRATDAPREPPKYMGCGVCDSYSKSQSLDEPTDDHSVITAEVQKMIRTFACPWIDLRGVGIQMKLDDEELKTKPIESKQQTISQSIHNDNQNMPPPSPKRKMKMIPIIPKPKRNYTTLTQLASKIDISVLNELPTQIRQEVIDHENISYKRQQRPIQLPRPTTLNLPLYQPIDFFGRKSPQQIRNYISQWIDSTIDSGPHYDDVCIFENYFLDVITYDSNWNKACQLLQWMRSYIHSKPAQGEWSTLIDIYCRIAHEALLNKRHIRTSI